MSDEHSGTLSTIRSEGCASSPASKGSGELCPWPKCCSHLFTNLLMKLGAQTWINLGLLDPNLAFFGSVMISSFPTPGPVQRALADLDGESDASSVASVALSIIQRKYSMYNILQQLYIAT